MIVVDSSALIAILLNEPEKLAFEATIACDERCVVSAVNVHETACVLRARFGADAVGRLGGFLTKAKSKSPLSTKSKRVSPLPRLRNSARA